MSLGLGDSVEAGQVGTVTPRRGHPPSARASPSWGPSGSPSRAGLHAALSASTATRGRWLLGAAAWICFRITTHTSGSFLSTFGIGVASLWILSPGCSLSGGYERRAPSPWRPEASLLSLLVHWLRGLIEFVSWGEVWASRPVLLKSRG